jgi:hypothetical protein
MAFGDLDRGIEDGVRWATAHAGDRARLGRIVRAHTPAEVVALVEQDGEAPGDAGDASAYWSGFAHGVGRVIRETADSR